MRLRALFAVTVITAFLGIPVVASADERSLGDWVRSRCAFTPRHLDCNDPDRRHGIESLEVRRGTVLWNATVVDTRDGSLRRHRVIVVDDGKIRAIAPVWALRIRIRGEARAIDASGKYVVPGYLDMHTHALDGAERQPTKWPLLIANGITGIREMGGVSNAIQLAEQVNADSAAGRIDAPEILATPGDILAAVASAASAVQGVQQRKAAGSDFIKVVSANREGMLAILSEAGNQGLDVAGHLTPALSARESSAAGMKAIEHLGSGIGSLLDCSSDEAGVRQALLAGPGPTPPPVPSWTANAANAPLFQRVLETYSRAKCVALAQVFVRNGTWHVPTLYRVRALETTDDPLFPADPNLIYVDMATRTLWNQLAQQFAANIPPAGKATFRQYYGLQQSLAQLLKQNGVKMLTGSDTADIAVWMVPGFSLHQEFRELAAAGLSPLEILQMTTLNGAEFLQREATMGTVDEGKNADLVLLDANPLRRAENLSKIWAVVLKGKYFSKHALEKLKRDVATAYGASPARTVSTAAEADHSD